MGLTKAHFKQVQSMASWVLPQLDHMIELFYQWLANQPEWETFFSDPDRVQLVKQLQVKHWRDLFSTERLDREYLQRRVRVGEVHARIGLSLAAYFSGVEQSFQLFASELRHPDGRGATVEEVSAMGKMLHVDAMLVIEAYNLVTQRKIADQAEALLEMSTPVAELWESVLLLPIVGVVDSSRAREMMGSVLRHIAESRAKVLIIDISGVPVVDTAVADHLVKMTRATRLMGCSAILSGLSAAVAQTIVELGINIEGIETTATLRDATARAYRQVGLRLAPME